MPQQQRQTAAFACGAVLLAFALPAGADTVMLGASKDNTLMETDDGSLSNGSGDGIFVGRLGFMGDGLLRRGVIAFDVAGSVPAGSTITSVTLTAEVLLSAPGSGARPARLNKLLADWGEGASSSGGGNGAPSETDDATWIHTFYPDQFWTSAGGDFTVSTSATIDLNMPGSYTWGSTVRMVQDVQGWLDSPATNFGWLVRGDETELQTAKKLASRENFDTQARPVLEIEFDPPSPCPWDCDGSGDGIVGVDDFLAVLSRWGQSATSCHFAGGATVGVDEFLDVLAHWGLCP